AYRFQKFVRRHKAAVTAAGLVLLVLLGGIAGTTWGLARALRQQREAQRQARIAQQTTDFLTGMFQSINPQGKQREITLQEVVDEAGRTLGTAFPHEPMVEMPLQRMIGGVYGVLERNDLALPHAEAELRLARAVYGT